MKIRNVAALCAVLAVCALAAVGCGKKTPPQVPRQEPLPIVKDLRVEGEGRTIILRWSLPPAKTTAESDVAGFAVYRAETVIDADCRDCPQRYEMIGRVDRQQGRISPAQWQYLDQAAPGYVYRYQVRCYTPEGEQGRAAGPVRYVMKQAAGAGNEIE